MDAPHHIFNHAFAFRGTPAPRRILVVLASRRDHYQKCLPRLEELFAGASIAYLAGRHNTSEMLATRTVIYTDAPLMTADGLGADLLSTFGDYDLIIVTLNNQMGRTARHHNLFNLFYDHHPVYVLNSSYTLVEFDEYFYNRAIATAGGVKRVYAEMQQSLCQYLHDTARRLAPGSTVVEIGRWSAGSTICLGYGASAGDSRVISIDPVTTALAREQLARSALNNITLWEMTSTEAYFRWQHDGPGPPVDCLFIDGAHDLVTESSDILIWKRLLKPGGRIIVHDYLFHEFPDVSYAVHYGIVKTNEFEGYEYVEGDAFSAVKK